MPCLTWCPSRHCPPQAPQKPGEDVLGETRVPSSLHSLSTLRRAAPATVSGSHVACAELRVKGGDRARPDGMGTTQDGASDDTESTKAT